VGNSAGGTPGQYTLVGQLCTPKDVLARALPLVNPQVGDLLLLPLAGAYGYNISHVDFLCHPRPPLHFIEGYSGQPPDHSPDDSSDYSTRHKEQNHAAKLEH
jgi:hypothetical protein